MPRNIEKKILHIRKKMMELHPVHPGKITKQFNVCGTPGCRCKREENPQKHGPYFYLSYTFKGKGKTIFVPKALVEQVRVYTQNYQQLKELNEELIQLNIDLIKEEVFKDEGRTKRD